MTLGYEKLDVYCLSISYVAWIYEKANNLKGSGFNLKMCRNPGCPGGRALAETKSQERKVELDRIAAMLCRLG